MKKFMVLCTVVSVFAVICLISTPGFAWKVEKNKNNIRVYSRPAGDTGLKEFRAVTVIDVNTEVIGVLLRDTPSFPNWMYNIKEAKVVKKIDMNNMTTYLVLKMPMPLSDRDMVVEAKTVYNLGAGRSTVYLKGVKETIVPVTEEYVRMTKFTGEYVIEYISTGKTRIIYTMKCDPEVDAPKFIVNSDLEKTAYGTLLGMRKAAVEEKYIAAAKNSPDRKLFDKLIKDRASVQKIMVTRLAEFFRENENKIDDIISRDRSIIDNIMKNQGSFESIRDAFKKGCRLYLLSRYPDNKTEIEEIINDREYEGEIIDGLFYGSGTGELPVIRRINKKLNK